MKKLIPVSVIVLMSAPAYADLLWSTPTTWNDDAITSALTSVNADDATTQNFNARWGATTNKTVNGAYMGALYAAALGGNVAPIAAVDAGYDFMQYLLAAQSGNAAGDVNGNASDGPGALEKLITEHSKKVCLDEITKTILTGDKREIVKIDDHTFAKCNTIDPAPGVVAGKQLCTNSIFYDVAVSKNDVDVDMYQCVVSYSNPTVSDDGTLNATPTVRFEYMGETKQSAADINKSTDVKKYLTELEIADDAYGKCVSAIKQEIGDAYKYSSRDNKNVVCNDDNSICTGNVSVNVNNTVSVGCDVEYKNVVYDAKSKQLTSSSSAVKLNSNDMQKLKQQSTTAPTADNNAPLTDADIERAKRSLAALLDNTCSNMSVIKNSTDWVAHDSKLNCTRVSGTDNVFQCDYSRQYIMGANQNVFRKKSYVCRTRNNGSFRATFYKDGRIESDAIVGMFEEGTVQDNTAKTEQNNTAAPAEEKDVSVRDAEYVVMGVCRDRCYNQMIKEYSKWGEFVEQDFNVKCTKRSGTKNEFECRFQEIFETDKAKQVFCNTSFGGKVVHKNDHFLLDGRNGDISMTSSGLLMDTVVKPMPTPTLESNIDIIKRVEPTKKEQRQAARAVKKEMREIEKREKSGKTNDDEKPSYVAPLTDGTEGDLGPGMDTSTHDIFDVNSYTSTTKQQTKSNKKTNKNAKENNTTSAPAAPLPPRASVPEPDYLEQDLYTTKFDIL